jgi:4-alpha-glucanotransferase
MNEKRCAGILLHPTSLPGPDGIGDLGPDAWQWVKTVKQMGFTCWQILPLGPTGFGDSPYQCFSAFAGNPLLISPLLLVEDGLLTLDDLARRPSFSAEQVDFGAVIAWKNALLTKAFQNYLASPRKGLNAELNAFAERNKDWLDDYALFMTIKEACGLQPWSAWEKPLKMRDEKALREFSDTHRDETESQKFRQFLFFRQWRALKDYAAHTGIKIIGDTPIFAANDSADAWAHPELFHYDQNRNITFVAGVPPDYFSSTGQLWGNPLYNWEKHRQTGYAWWISRIRAALELVDVLRIDHFRGFVDYWEIPAGMPTAEIGQWKPGPGQEFFDAVRAALGGLPLIAEDLGEINPEVYVLRDRLGLPGMKILQFAFGSGPRDDFLPHNYPNNCVAYTGTHDNDTTIGWYESAPEHEKDFCRRYLRSSGADIAWDMLHAVWASVADMAVAPLQDFLRKGTQARMNFPGKLGGNWGWRFINDEITPGLIHEIAELNYIYGRKPGN